MARPILAYDFSVLENNPWTGVERYALAMLRYLPDVLADMELVAIWRRPPAESLAKDSKRWTNRIDKSCIPRSLWRRLNLPRHLKQIGANIIVAPVAHVPILPQMISCRTIHDLPSSELAAIEKSSWLSSIGRKQWHRQDVPTIFPSLATQVAFESQFPLAAATKAVILHGFEPQDPLPATCEPTISPWKLLVVGTVRERRMPAVLQEAFLLIRELQPNARLRWIGRQDVDVAPYPQIEFLGELSDSEKEAELRDANCLICPSLIEGFGFPLLEGLAAQKSVVAADHDTSREVGGRFPIFYDGRSAQDLVRALKESFGNPKPNAELQTQRAHALSFTWDKSARQHADFFRSLL